MMPICSAGSPSPSLLFDTISMSPLTTLTGFWLQKSSPVSLIHFVTNRCTSRCRHCFIDFSDPAVFEHELTLDEIRSLSRTFGKYLFNVNLTGGEPFLRDDLFDILECYFINARVRSVYITSNGYFADKMLAFVQRFLASPLHGKLHISISLDDMEELHDELRNTEGLFKKALASIHALQPLNCNRFGVNAAITLTPWNRERALMLYDMLCKQNVQSVTATLYREGGAARRISSPEKAALLTTYKALTDQIRRDLRTARINNFKTGLQGAIMNAKNEMVNEMLPDIVADNRFYSTCPAASLFGVIYPNGDIYPCELLSHRPLGNIRNTGLDFQALWAAPAARKCAHSIQKSRCRCSFECAWTINILSHLRYWPKLLWKTSRLLV